VRFVFALKNGEDLVTGEGVVLRMRRDSGDPRRPPGMELRYELLDEASQAMVERLLAARKTPPPYVSMRIDGVADSQQVTLPIPQIDPTLVASSSRPRPAPTLLAFPPPPPKTPVPLPPPLSSAPPPLPPRSPVPLTNATRERPPASLAPVALSSPDMAARPWRFVGFGLVAAAGMLAMVLAMAIISRARPAATGVGGNGVGGNGVVAGGAAPVAPANVPPASAPPPVVAGPRPASTGGARPPPPPPRPRTAGRALELRVTTSPTGSTIFVDGEERGPSPLTVSVAAGAHDIVAERPRWVAAHAHVDGPGRVQLVLERPLAHLHVNSTPAGAAVRLDGRDLGPTPLDVDAAAYEEHHLRIELDGRVWKRKIYLRPPGRTVRVGDAPINR
jgi:hypothetical protein